MNEITVTFYERKDLRQTVPLMESWAIGKIYRRVLLVPIEDTEDFESELTNYPVEMPARLHDDDGWSGWSKIGDPQVYRYEREMDHANHIARYRVDFIEIDCVHGNPPSTTFAETKGTRTRQHKGYEYQWTTYALATTHNNIEWQPDAYLDGVSGNPLAPVCVAINAATHIVPGILVVTAVWSAVRAYS